MWAGFRELQGIEKRLECEGPRERDVSGTLEDLGLSQRCTAFT